MRRTLNHFTFLAAIASAACSTETEDVGVTIQEFTAGVVTAEVQITSDWGAGYCSDVLLQNGGSAPVTDWAVTMDFGGSQVNNLWNGVRSGNVVTSVAHNGSIAPGQAVTFGFCANGSGRPTVVGVEFDGGGDGDPPPPQATCSDGVQNQGETGIDCGGPCAACQPTATCSDGVQNQGETGVDCGGPCQACSTGGNSCDDLKTWVDNDWRLTIAAGEVIQYQGERYQANVAIPYPNGSCTPDGPAGWCSNWFRYLGACGDDNPPPQATCSDGIQNQGETGIDCGGPCSACQPTATCSDGIQNQGETGVDCGGPCSACQPTATCSDGIQNQGETGVDCGGPCQACANLSCNGFATRYWDCCKPHCAWDGNVPMSMEPAQVCDSNDNPTNSGAQSACSGGSGYQCHDYAPWAVSSNLSYGYAAVAAGGDICGRCYEVEFTGQGHHWNDPGSQALAGKKMVVQALNIGGDVGSGQFDILIPGGGVGAFNGCSAQWGVSNSELGAQYGGFLTTCRDQGGSFSQVKSCVLNKCQSVFGSRGLTELQEGCEWFVNWFEAADNPNLRYREVSCPAALTGTSNMDRTPLNDVRNSCL